MSPENGVLSYYHGKVGIFNLTSEEGGGRSSFSNYAKEVER